MIYFNDPKQSKERADTKPLEYEECVKVIETLNSLISATGGITTDRIALIQRFVNNYENMEHYTLYTSGLWATENPEKAKFDSSQWTLLNFMETNKE